MYVIVEIILEFSVLGYGGNVEIFYIATCCKHPTTRKARSPVSTVNRSQKKNNNCVFDQSCQIVLGQHYITPFCVTNTWYCLALHHYLSLFLTFASLLFWGFNVQWRPNLTRILNIFSSYFLYSSALTPYASLTSDNPACRTLGVAYLLVFCVASRNRVHGDKVGAQSRVTIYMKRVYLKVNEMLWNSTLKRAIYCQRNETK